jgi:Heterokaryon incompatibility protein (HET)
MNHIPQSHDSPHSPLEIPYLIEFLDDRTLSLLQSVDSLAAYREFEPNVDIKASGLISNLSIVEPSQDLVVNVEGSDYEVLELGWDGILPFIQAACFFDLLKKVFRVPGILFNEGDFIQDKNGEKFVTTATLPELLVKWEDAEQDISRTERRDKYMVIDRHVSRACEFLMAHGKSLVEIQYSIENAKQPLDGNYATFELVKKVHLSAMILAETLWHASLIIYRGYERPHQGLIMGLNPVNSRRFEQAGWCPRDYQMVVDDVFTDANAVQFMLSSIDRRSDTRNHSTCSLKECKFDIVPDGPYKHRHTEVCNGQCNYITPGDAVMPGQITKIIEAGFTPLLRFAQQRSDGQHMMNITTSHKFIVDKIAATLVHGPVVPYVAFSHVWSQGLGNPDGNSLPKCQLLHLQNLANQIASQEGHPVPFWIDTICVPIEPKYRKLAIKSMSQVYREAKYVIVLDTSLLRVPRTLDPVEIAMRIAITTWTHRLWTYQEATLADTLLFQFQDSLVEVNDLRRRYLAKRRQMIVGICPTRSAFQDTILDWPSVDIIWHDAIGAMKEISFATAYQDEAGEHNKLSLLNKALAVRSTTKAEDEAICLASILGRDVGKVLDTEKGGGMKYLLTSLGTVSGDIIFCNRPRYEEKGQRWIPKSLLRDPIANKINMNETPAKVTANGLVLAYPGIRWRLTPTAKLVKLNLITITASGELYSLKAPRRLFDAKVEQMELVATETYGVIWPCLWAGKIEPGQDNQTFREAEELIAALVRIEKQEDGVDFCRLLTNLHVCRLLTSHPLRSSSSSLVPNAEGEKMPDAHV